MTMDAHVDDPIKVGARRAEMQIPLALAAVEMMCVASMFLLLFYGLKWVLGAVTRSLKPSVVSDMANKSVSSFFAIMATLTGIFLMTAEERVKQELLVMEHILCVVVAYFLYDSISMYKVFESKFHEDHPDSPLTGTGLVFAFVRAQPLLLVHHLSLALIFAPMMSQCLNHEPGDLMVGCALIFEASTPFVSLRAVLSHLGLKHSFVYMVNGLLMVVIFPFCRIFIYFWFYYIYARQKGLSFTQGVLVTPPHCAVFMTLVLLPQLYWYRLMVRGAWKIWTEREKGE